MSISEVARQLGLRPSTIRYYEQCGILPPALRKSGQRRYDNSALYRLALIQRARRTGFTLDEIRELFFGFGRGTPAGKRWKKLSQQKLVELDAAAATIDEMRDVLKRLEKCGCDGLEECGRKIYEYGCSEAATGKR